jgi:16S rRNA (guanine527-N7)-methyltransferase
MPIKIDSDTFSSFYQVSRETTESLKKYENILIKANKKQNLIGKSTIKNIWIRHFLDSMQAIDFVDKNDKTLIDLGSGAGFPGLIIAIAAKDRGLPIRIKLVEKSPKKAKFLKQVIMQLKLNVDVLNENIFESKKKLIEDVFIARAFKPLDEILKLMHKISDNWKKIIIFLGKTGQKELLQASKTWDIEYKKRMSITNSDSLIIEIKKYKKK